jgi:hypothetical protein
MRSLKDLVHQSNEELASLDVAEVHLACSVGFLRVSADDCAACLVAVEDCAGLVKGYTEAKLPHWRERPQDFPRHREEAGFRLQCMADVFLDRLECASTPTSSTIARIRRSG